MQEELAFTKDLILQAGAMCLEYYNKPFLVEEKEGHGPVTEADRAINRFLVSAIQKRFPEDGFLAEESIDQKERLTKRRVWAIDPIDGTREFVAKSGEFSVMIGLSIEKEPVMGFILRPTTKTLYYAAKGFGAWRQEANEPPQQMRVSGINIPSLRMAVAKPWRGRRVEVIRAYLGIEEIVSMGSISLKLAMIASGEADVYVNPSGYLAEWDTCAGEAILREAGGMVTDLTGGLLSYNEDDVTRPRGILASNGVCHQRVLRGVRALRIRLQREGLLSATSLPIEDPPNERDA